MVNLRFVIINLLRLRFPPKCYVQIGKYTQGVPHIISAERSDKIIIGKYCSIGPNVILVPHPGHIPDKKYRDYRVSTYTLTRIGKRGWWSSYWKSSYYLPSKRNFIIIGNDVWIGANVIILSGVKIGDGAIIGAGAVVTKDIPPYAIAYGVPAEVRGYRYDKDTIQKLLKIAWWNWSEKKIIKYMDYFYGKVSDFVNKFYNELITSRNKDAI
jgi:virginiamycin A acetyltransferase